MSNLGKNTDNVRVMIASHVVIVIFIVYHAVACTYVCYFPSSLHVHFWQTEYRKYSLSIVGLLPSDRIHPRYQNTHKQVGKKLGIQWKGKVNVASDI